MAKKLICFGVLVMMLFAFAGCGGNKYNAVMYHDAGEWMQDIFLKENMTFGAYNEYEDKWTDDESYPESRIFIIKKQTEYDEVFTEFPPGINFEKEMLVLYIFTCTVATWPYSMKKVSVDGSTVKIEYRLKNAGDKNNGSVPHQRCFVVKMDKLEINTAEFKKI